MKSQNKSLIPPASIMKTKIILMIFAGKNFKAKEPTMPPSTTPVPTVRKEIVSKFPLKK